MTWATGRGTNYAMRLLVVGSSGVVAIYILSNLRSVFAGGED